MALSLFVGKLPTDVIVEEILSYIQLVICKRKSVIECRDSETGLNRNLANMYGYFRCESKYDRRVRRIFVSLAFEDGYQFKGNDVSIDEEENLKFESFCCRKYHHYHHRSVIVRIPRSVSSISIKINTFSKCYLTTTVKSGRYTPKIYICEDSTRDFRYIFIRLQDVYLGFGIFKKYVARFDGCIYRPAKSNIRSSLSNLKTSKIDGVVWIGSNHASKMLSTREELSISAIKLREKAPINEYKRRRRWMNQKGKFAKRRGRKFKRIKIKFRGGNSRNRMKNHPKLRYRH